MTRFQTIFGVGIVALGVTAAMLPSQGVAQNRVERATTNCLTMLEQEYGIEQKTVDRVNTRDSDNVLIHVRTVLPDGRDEYVRCQVNRRGDGIREIRVFREGFAAGERHEDWAPAGRILRVARTEDDAPEAPSAPALAPATPKVVGAGRETVERGSGARSGVGRIGATRDEQGESSGGPRSYTVQ